MTAPPKIYPYEPRFHFDPPDLPNIPSPNKPPPTNWPLPFIPKFQTLPNGRQPTLEGYPWWVDPTFLNPPPAPIPPPTPRSPLGPSDVADDKPANWLLSYYNQYLAPQSGAQPENGFDPAAQDSASQQDIPERRLGRRTYRA